MKDVKKMTLENLRDKINSIDKNIKFIYRKNEN